MFSIIKNNGEIAGVFVGHDHANDYAGVLDGIALVYGRITGFDDGYGKLPKGARIIELKEGEKQFKTWIRLFDGKILNTYSPKL